MPNLKPSLSVIIPIFRDLDAIKYQLSEWHNTFRGYPDVEFIVVDLGCDEALKTYVITHWPEVVLRRFERPTGMAMGLNCVFDALDRDWAFVVFPGFKVLNPQFLMDLASWDADYAVFSSQHYPARSPMRAEATAMGALMIRQGFWSQLEGFDLFLDPGPYVMEDWVFRAKRVGGRGKTIADAVSRETFPFKRQSGYFYQSELVTVRNTCLLNWKHRRSWLFWVQDVMLHLGFCLAFRIAYVRGLLQALMLVGAVVRYRKRVGLLV